MGMCPIDIGTAIDRCERTIVETPRLLSLLHNPDRISTTMGIVKDFVRLLGKNPSLGIILRQLNTILLDDDELRTVLKTECKVEDDSELFPFFMFFCTIIIYTEYIRLGEESGGEE